MKRSSVTTMKDIAEKAGVSITTVSHVINKTRHVNQETKNSVLKAIDELNYRNRNIKKKKRKTKSIGIIVADIREDFYTSIIKSIETVAADLNISITFCDSEDDPEKERKNITMMLAQNISGLILAPIGTHIPKSLETASIPVVLIDRQYETHPYLFVGINNLQSCYLGTSYLIKNDCHRIGFIGYSETVYTIHQRILGYKSRLIESSEQTEPKILCLQYHKEDSYPLIKEFITHENLDGIICATSTVCYEVINVLEDLEDTVQNRLKIVSYDDNRWFDYLKYPISAISQPTAEIGSTAVENILQLIDKSDKAPSVKRELFFDINIIDRLN